MRSPDGRWLAVGWPTPTSSSSLAVGRPAADPCRLERVGPVPFALVSYDQRLVLRALIVAALLAAPAEQLGRSYEGRPIDVVHIAGTGKRILVVGCIHGDECEGIEVTRLLARSHSTADLWLVHQLNPDGYARGSRTNAHGVDLNRDFLAATQRETRIARKLILRLKPDITIWFHQPQAVVRAWGPSRATARRYAQARRRPVPRAGLAARKRVALAERPRARSPSSSSSPRASWQTRPRAATPPRSSGWPSRFGACSGSTTARKSELEELLEDGPVLLLFYLFDWSPT